MLAPLCRSRNTIRETHVGSDELYSQQSCQAWLCEEVARLALLKRGCFFGECGPRESGSDVEGLSNSGLWQRLGRFLEFTNGPA